jgi:hypothetical protein
MDSITYDFRQASPEDSLNNHQHQHQPQQQKQQQQQQKGAKFYRQDSYYDSLGDFTTPTRPDQKSSPAKKLIIPYNNGSFSSNTSIYSGSRDGSLAGSDYDVSISSKTAEPDSLTPCMSAADREDNVTLKISALQERNNSVSEDEHMTPQIRRTPAANSLAYSGSPTARITEVWRPDSFQLQQQQQQQPYRHRSEVVSRPGSRTQSPIRMMSQQNNPLVNQSLMRMATERMKRKFLGWN